MDFTGKEIAQHEMEIGIEKNANRKLTTIVFNDVLGGAQKASAALILELKDQQGVVVSSQHNLLVADKQAALQKPAFTTRISAEGSQGTLSITADRYSRYTWLQLDGVHTPLSDNFFDMEAGQTVNITFAIPEGMKAADITVRIMDLTAVGVRGSLAHDKWVRAKLFLRPTNFLFFFMFKFLI